MGSAAADTYRQIADGVARIGGCSVSSLGLRFDRVAVRVLGELELSSTARVPEGSSVLFTVTAPIRSPGKTVVALQREIAALLVKGGAGSEWSGVLLANRASLRLVEHAATPGHTLLGFVHNPDVAAATVLDLAEAWLWTGAGRTDPVQ